METLLSAVSGRQQYSPTMRTGASQGLAPRFEALQNRQVSKLSPCGVSAKALTPPPLHDYIADDLRLKYYIIDWF